DDLTKPWRTPSSLIRRDLQLCKSYVTLAKGTINHDHDIEDAKITGRCEKCFGRSRDLEASSRDSYGEGLRVAADIEATPSRSGILLVHCRENWVSRRIWQPPPAQFRGG